MTSADGRGDDRAGHRLRRALIALCVTEVTSWGVLYYAFPAMLGSVTQTTGWSTSTALSAFSTGLLVSAVVGVPVGRLVDRFGPRRVMTTGSVLAVLSLLGVAAADTLPWFFAAWAGAGIAQSMVLYPPAFAALTRWYGPRRVPAITVLSLVGGLASTVFAPPAAAIAAELGWRNTYLLLAAVLAIVTIPLHAVFLTPSWPAEAPRPAGTDHPGTAAIRGTVGTRAFGCLVLAMTLAAFGLYGATVNVVPLLTGRGIGGTAAAVVLGLVGAGQVLGRIGYPTLTRRTTARVRTVLILTVGAVSVAVLGILAGPLLAVIAVAMWAGAVRGSYTLLQATAVSDRWGTRHFGVRNGIAIAPATAAQAIAPAGTALLADRLGDYPTAYLLLAGLVLAGAAVALGSGVTGNSGRLRRRASL